MIQIEGIMGHALTMHNSYGEVKFGQHWFGQWLGTYIWRQAITGTFGDLLLNGHSGTIPAKFDSKHAYIHWKKQMKTRFAYTRFGHSMYASPCVFINSMSVDNVLLRRFCYTRPWCQLQYYKIYPKIVYCKQITTQAFLLTLLTSHSGRG